MQDPLNKVVIIQKVAAFNPCRIENFIKLAHVNKSWADTIKNYSFHLFGNENRLCEETTDTFKEVYLRALRGDIIWLLNALLSNKSFLDRMDCHEILTKETKRSALQIETMKFAVNKIVEVGGADLLRSQLDKTRREDTLLSLCLNSSSNAAIELFLITIFQVDSPDVLKQQLIYQDGHGSSCLMCLCYNSSTNAQTLRSFLDKLVEVGGNDLLKSVIAAKDGDGDTAIMNLVIDSPSIVEKTKLMLSKIVEIGGADFLTSQLTATNRGGYNFLMKLSKNTRVDATKLHEMMKFVCDKSVEVGGIKLLQAQVTPTDGYGMNCNMLLCANRGLDSQSKNQIAAMFFRTDDTSSKATAATDVVGGTDAISINLATMRKYFDFFDSKRTGLMDKSSVCAAIVACFPMSSTIGIAQRVQAKKCKEANQRELDFDDFCSIVKDVLS